MAISLKKPDPNAHPEPAPEPKVVHHHPLIQPHVAHPEEHGEGNWLVSYADMMTLLVGFFIIMMSFSKIDEDKFEEVRKAVTKEFGGKYDIPYRELSQKIIEMAQKLGVVNQFMVRETTVGVEIAFRGTVFFDPGKTELKGKASEILTQLIQVISEEKGDFDITVEGHTDDVPLSPGAVLKNNFELSSLRACRVVDAFARAGFPKDRLIAIGYGETRPVVPNRTPEGEAIPANQSQNRRVVVKISKHETPNLPAANGTPPTAPPPEVPGEEAAPAPAEAPSADPATDSQIAPPAAQPQEVPSTPQHE